MSKVVLITGTSSGLGLATAVQMAEQGFKVYASMRNLNSAKNLQSAMKEKGLSYSLLRLDVQETESVQAAVEDIIEKEKRIDILINNAGAGFVKTTEHASEEEIAWVMDVNFSGVVRCTKAVLPYMRRQGSGHIINVTSVGGLVGQPFNEIYCAAKFAVEGYTESLAAYVQPNFGVKFTLVEPGGISSEFANSVIAQLESSTGLPEDEYLPILRTYIAAAQQRSKESGVYQSANEVAELILSVVNSDNPPIRIRTSKWAEKFSELKTMCDPDGKKQQALLS
ncbi:SDR family oxidoreductase [Glaciecola sp. MH2013]|uniref:SDR family oxidoreductase n=1 Tax=Glaciecola sp. MH2013 TaxID=2785524 RepID=UPI00189FCD93|nr:SDR family oxidoreductase [Glaciecola sp. MH2013]MBF7073429.1 SDR family oxidoreductase [Glaciecola sp. MH2013]